MGRNCETSDQRSTTYGEVVQAKPRLSICTLNRMFEALDPTGAICGPYGEGVGAGVCVGPWLL